MGKGGRSGGGSRPSARTAPPPARTSAPANNQVQQQRAAPPPQKPQAAAPPPHAPPAAAPQQGMGMLGMVGSMAAGSMLGNVLSDKLMGGGDQPQQMEAAPQMNQQQFQNPCAQWRWGFDSCLAQNPNSINVCQVQFDQYQQCMSSQQWS